MNKLMKLIGIILILIANLSAATGFLEVTSNPVGVKVFIDGKYIGTTNNQNALFAELTTGSHTLKGRKNGFSSFNKSIHIKENELTEFSIMLSTVKTKVEKIEKQNTATMVSDVAHLVLTSMPPKLKVTINGKGYGTTPIKVSNISTGKKKITIGNKSTELLLNKNDSLSIKLEKGNFKTKHLVDYKKYWANNKTLFPKLWEKLKYYKAKPYNPEMYQKYAFEMIDNFPPNMPQDPYEFLVKMNDSYYSRSSKSYFDTAIDYQEYRSERLYWSLVNVCLFQDLHSLCQWTDNKNIDPTDVISYAINKAWTDDITLCLLMYDNYSSNTIYSLTETNELFNIYKRLFEDKRFWKKQKEYVSAYNRITKRLYRFYKERNKVVEMNNVERKYLAYYKNTFPKNYNEWVLKKTNEGIPPIPTQYRWKLWRN